MRDNDDLAAGELVYRVRWRDGTPYITHGVVILVGTKKKIRRVKAHYGGFENISSDYWKTPARAIRNELERVFFVGTPFLNKRHTRQSTWDTAINVVDLLRLYHKLKRNKRNSNRA